MFTTLLECLAMLSFTEIPDDEDEEDDKTDDKSGDDQDDQDSADDEDDQDDQDDKTDDEDDKTDGGADDEDDQDDQDEEDDSEPKGKDKPKLYPEDVVKRLRTENKARRQKQKTSTERIKELEADIKELKRGRTAAGKKSGASSRLEEEIDTLKTKVNDLTNKNADLVELQTQTDQVLTIGRMAEEIGFNDATDAVAFLSTRTSEYITSDGDIDEDALRSELEELLEEKPYLSHASIQERKDKQSKSRKEAARTDNKSSSQKIDAPKTKKGKTQSEDDVNKEIRQKLNQEYDGRGALKVFLAKKYIPKTGREHVTVS